MLGYVFSLFSINPLRQLIIASPLVVLGLFLTFISVFRLRKQHKKARLILGSSILITLAAYSLFILMELLLSSTNTSFGAAQPVIIFFGYLYLLSFGFWLSFITLLFFSEKLRNYWRVFLQIYTGLHLALLALLFYGFYIEPSWVDITTTTISESKLAPGTPPLKIVLISDIHMERWTHREDDVLAKIKSLEPDLVIISGDHINVDFRTPESYIDLHRFFLGLNARYGVYAVAGVVDSLPDTRRAMADTPVQLLDNEVKALSINGQSITLLGVRSDREATTELLDNLSQQAPPDALKLLIYHTPDFAAEAAKAGIDLVLVGHTHGGQIALPFFGAVFTASNYGRKYAAGLFDIGGPNQSKMYVTRGLGMEGFHTPRLRLFARPEISVINLVAK